MRPILAAAESIDATKFRDAFSTAASLAGKPVVQTLAKCAVEASFT
jgi:hypothetical protein